ncbi:unnamed protein product (macronuclear) [Paramecium tetraurelia]|uniref:Uncharacterized protein n=1 Tax=Paramecium tetraurelia TaxID=5888 RepID=A0EE68_PARTE|nr:uncharacterized protein GSPATT00025929001 [Paramecium tetraurelia]CAK93585.1 unnamed protein product [Paramecium tetraurelia]|eukprot:XP_001460982.1 hypothetical protein (macronuclear) [Paramecium tetraurelia strain d4-2]
MDEFQTFFHSLGEKQQTPISEDYRKQFKIRGEFIYPHNKKFDQICKSFLEDEKLRSKRKWDNSFKLFLIWFLVKYFEKQNQITIRPGENDWINFENILKIDKHALQQRWITLINPQMKSINWLQEEDDFIKNQMNQKNKHIWTQIAVSLYERSLQGNIRTPKQIRERWMNYLNPELNKEQWLLKEDLIILNNVVKNGKKWSQISQQLNGRTENQVKNRYKSLIHKICKDDECDEIEMIKQYIRKNSAHMDSNKQGIIGKRGRHKKGMRNKEQKAEAKKQKNIPKIIKQEEQLSQQPLVQQQQQAPQQQLFTQSQQLQMQQQMQQTQQLQQLQQLQQQMNFNQEEMKLALNLQSTFNQEDMKNATPLMMLQCLTSPGYQYFENQCLRQLSPGMIEEVECHQNSSLQLPKMANIYKVNSTSPFLLGSMMQSPFWNNDQFIQQNEDQVGATSNQTFTQQISTTPYLNLNYFRPQQMNGFSKQKELDLLQENPIQQFNKRRNINQQ